MGMYIGLVSAVLLLFRLLPRKQAVAASTLLHILLSGLRHPHLTGDLMKYHWQFLNGGEQTVKNFGFSLVMQGVSRIFHGNYQMFLFLISAVYCGAVGILLEKDCRRPWLGFWVLNCLGLYIGTFSAIKQALAMGLVLLAYTGIRRGDFRRFLIPVLVAGTVHFPALIFLPAWWLTRLRFDGRMAAVWVIAAGLLWLAREPVTGWLGGLYYEEWTVSAHGVHPGGRFFLLVAILTAGLVLRGSGDPAFSRLAQLMAMGTLIQLLGVCGNVFTRLADYYVQFAVLFIPNMLDRPDRAVLPLDAESRRVLAAIGAVFLGWFYWHTCLGVEIAYGTDNYVNYQFFWEVR